MSSSAADEWHPAGELAPPTVTKQLVVHSFEISFVNFLERWLIFAVDLMEIWLLGLKYFQGVRVLIGQCMHFYRVND